MPFLQVDGFTVPVLNETPSRRIDTEGRRGRSARGQMRQGERGHRRVWEMTTPPLSAALAKAVQHMINGEGHLIDLKDGLHAATGLGPLPGAVMGQIDPGLDIKFPTLTGGMVIPAANLGAVLRYDAQLSGPWTILWRQEFGQGGYARRSDGVGYFNGAVDLTVGDPAGTGIYPTVTDGVLEIIKDGAGAISIDDLLILPYLAHADQLVAWTTTGHMKWSPRPLLYLQGDFVADPLIVGVGQVMESTLIASSSKDGDGWHNDLRAIRFKLTEVDEMNAGAAVYADGENETIYVPPAPSSIQAAEVITSRENITIGATTYSAATSGEQHAVIVTYDTGGAAVWAAHAVAPVSGVLDILDTFSAPRIDSQGNVYVALWAGHGGSGGPGTKDLPVDIFDAVGSPKTTITCRRYTHSTQQTRDGMLMKFDITGELKWASQVVDTPDTDATQQSGGWRGVGAMELIDDDNLAVGIAFYSFGNMSVNLHTGHVATFMPDTHTVSPYTQTYNKAESWLMTVNTADGTVKSQPARISADSYVFTGPPFKTVPDSQSGATLLSINGTGKVGMPLRDDPDQYYEPKYKGVTSVVGAFGSQPAPTAPDQRWQTNTSAISSCFMVFDSWLGDLRWVIDFGIAAPTTPLGMKSVPGTDDWICAASKENTANPVTIIVRQNSTDRTIRDQGASAGRFGGSIFRMNDNSGTPTDPNLSWHTNFHTGPAGGTFNYRNQLYGDVLVIPDDDTVVFGGIVDSSTATLINSVGGGGTIGPFNPQDVHVPTNYNYLVMACKMSDGAPLWVQTFQTTNFFISRGEWIRKGREIIFTAYWRDEATLCANDASSENIVDAGNTRVQRIRLDITTGALKGWDDIEDDTVSSFGAIRHARRKGYADIDEDAQNLLVPVGDTVSSAAPVILNGQTPYIFSTEAALSSFQTLNTSTGVLTNTAPIAGDIGTYLDTVKVVDAGGDFSIQNTRSVFVEPYPDHQWLFDETSGTNAADNISTLDGTYQANALVNQTGKIGVGFDTTNSVNGGVILPAFTLGSAFTFSIWVDCANHASITDGALLFNFNNASGTPNYQIQAWETTSGNLRFEIFNSVGGQIGSLNSGNFYLTNVGYQKWTFWANGTDFGMQRGTTKWSGTLSSAFPSGSRPNCSIGQDSIGNNWFNAKFDHAELWKTRAMNVLAIDEAWRIENTGVAAF